MPADMPPPKSKVTILPPDQSMQKKLGDVKIDRILSDQAVQKAQNIITMTSEQFLQDSLKEMAKLEDALNALSNDPDTWQGPMKNIIDSAFTIKSQAAQGGFDLISTIAKSLLLRCESQASANLSPSNLAITEWHIESIKRLLDLKVKGNGGPIGEAILTELGKLPPVIAA